MFTSTQNKIWSFRIVKQVGEQLDLRDRFISPTYWRVNVSLESNLMFAIQTRHMPWLTLPCCSIVRRAMRFTQGIVVDSLVFGWTKKKCRFIDVVFFFFWDINKKKIHHESTSSSDSFTQIRMFSPKVKVSPLDNSVMTTACCFRFNRSCEANCYWYQRKWLFCV